MVSRFLTLDADSYADRLQTGAVKGVAASIAGKLSTTFLLKTLTTRASALTLALSRAPWSTVTMTTAYLQLPLAKECKEMWKSTKKRVATGSTFSAKTRPRCFSIPLKTQASPASFNLNTSTRPGETKTRYTVQTSMRALRSRAVCRILHRRHMNPPFGSIPSMFRTTWPS